MNKLFLALLLLPLQGTAMTNQQDLDSQLLKAVQLGTREQIEQLLQAGANPNAVTYRGYTPLHWAANRGLTDMAQLLLDKGANVNATDHRFGYTPLHIAASSGYTELAQLLL
ncbi:ankyrin repeat domain-containing protein [Candidatus Dependentiae bacterium]|nr:ankyrin repeat domain-containing protein [Candidatus Dependentiae bacterium]